MDISKIIDVEFRLQKPVPCDVFFSMVFTRCLGYVGASIQVVRGTNGFIVEGRSEDGSLDSSCLPWEAFTWSDGLEYLNRFLQKDELSHLLGNNAYILVRFKNSLVIYSISMYDKHLIVKGFADKHAYGFAMEICHEFSSRYDI